MSPRNHATSLRRAFRRILAVTFVAPLPVALVLACGSTGIVANGPEDAGGDGASSGPCRLSGPGDAPVPCKTNYLLPLSGDLSTCGFDDAGNGAFEFCATMCGERSPSCRRAEASVQCTVSCAVDGRRYANVDDGAAPSGVDVGSYLARMAFFEAVSVDAFAMIEHELARLGAPQSLVRSCREAKLDEVRHARMAATMARRHGAAVETPPSPAPRACDLETLAIENAVEGCVGETFGVLIGMWQSVAAPTAALRTFFMTLTNDELRHAALSGRIDEWARSQLSVASCRRVDAAKAEALAKLEASLLESEPPQGLGLPSGPEARKLFSMWQEGSTLLPTPNGARARKRSRLSPAGRSA